jgi:AcrR family transcriptional regulator
MRGATAARPARIRDRQRTEEKLFEAAVEAMSSLGYEGATTRRIADLAGVNEQLISRYFGGKAGLLAAILRSYTGTELARERAARPAAPDLQRDIAAFLAEADFPAEREPFARLALARALVDGEVAAAIDALRRDCYTPLLLERLRQHRDSGAIAAAADLELAADALVHLRLGLAAYGRLLFGLGTPHLKQVIDTAAGVFAAGLAPTAARAARPRR